MPGARAKHGRTELLVVGGGMVGLSLALAAAAGGLSVMVVDREPPRRTTEPDFDGRVSSVALGSARMLARLGVWAAIEAEAQPILEIRVSDRDSPLFLHYHHREVGAAPMGYIVENRVLRRALGAAVGAAGIEWRAPVAVEAVNRDPYRATAKLSDGALIEAPLVAAADGRRSALRRAAGIGVIDHRYRQTGIVCTVAHRRPHRGIAHERFLAAGPFAILPMTGRRASLVWTERSELVPALLALDDRAFLDELARRFGDFLGELEVIGPRWSYPLGVTLAERLFEARLALIGDAAHGIHPIAGQGLNLGLRDVAALAETITEARRLGLDIGDRAVLARYGRWRRFDGMTMAAVTDGLNRLFSNDIGPLRLARDLGLAAVNRLPPLKGIFIRHAMGLLGDPPRLMRGEPL